MRNAERLRCLNIPAPACRAAPSAADRNDLAGAPATPFGVLRAAARFAVFVSLVVGGAVGFGDDAQAQTFNSVVVFGASQFGADIDVGLVMGESEKYDHGPLVGFAWLNQTVDGYRESGSSSTSMNFSDFDFDSSIVRAGYRAAARSDSGRGGIRPYASIAYERELDDEPVSVTAGSNSMPGRFTLEGYSRQSNSISTSLGISMSLGGQTRAFAGYFGRLGGNSLRRHQLGVGLSF